MSKRVIEEEEISSALVLVSPKKPRTDLVAASPKNKAISDLVSN